MPSSEFYDHHESGPCFVGFLCCFGCGGGVRVGVAPEETAVLVGGRRRSDSRVLAGMKAEAVLHASVASMRASSQRRSSGPRGRRGRCRNGRPAGGPPGCARSRPGPPGTRTRRNPPAPGSKNPVAACPGDCRGDRSVEGLSRRGAIPGAGSGTRTGLPAGVQASWRSGPVVPARARARPVLPVPARHGSAVHDQGPGLVRVVCGRHEACEDLDRTGRPPADGPAGRGPTGPERLGRLGSGAVAPQVGRRGPDLFRLAQCR